MIDIHSHILPGLDDGSLTFEEYTEALREAKRQGITEIICTPHFYPVEVRPFVADEKGQNVCSSKRQIVEAYNKALPVAEQMGIKLHLGMECYYHSSLPALIEKGETLTLAGSRYMLIEFGEDATFSEIRAGLVAVMDTGHIPIVAHYERYKSLVPSRRIKQLREIGALFQLNFDTVQRYYGIFRRNDFRKDLKKGLVDFMGSDCHGTHFRKLRIVPSVEWMEKKLKDPQKILEVNPGKILNDEI